MKYTLIALTVFLAAGCATTTFYTPEGTPLAKVQGDLNGSMKVGSDGSVDIQGTLEHTSPTLAGGRAASSVVGASGNAVSMVAGSVGATSVAKKALSR